MKVTDMPIIVGVLWKVLKSYVKKLGKVEESKWSKIEYKGECERIKKKKKLLSLDLHWNSSVTTCVRTQLVEIIII